MNNHTKHKNHLRIVRTVATGVLANSLVFLIVAVSSSRGHRSGRHGGHGRRGIIETETTLHTSRWGRCQLRARPRRTVEETRGGSQAGHRISVRAGEHGRKAGVVAVFGRRGRLRLMATKSTDFFLHLSKLDGLTSLLLIQLLHLHLKATALLSDSLIFEFLLLDLVYVLARQSARCLIA